MPFSSLFTPICSDGLGGYGSSLDAIGTLIPTQSLGQAKQSLHINVANGNLFLRDHTKTLMDLGFSVALGYVYNSQAEMPWRLSVGKQVVAGMGALNTAGSTVSLTEEDGHRTTYTYDAASARYVAKGLVDGTATLTRAANGTWIRQQMETGVVEHYDENGLQTDRVDAAGRALQYAYDAQNRLTNITGASGQSYKIDYTPQKTAIYFNDGTQRILLMNYDWDAKGRLSATHIPVDAQTIYDITYAYNSSDGYLQTVQQGDGTRYDMTYDETHRVKTFVDGERRTTQFGYQDQVTTITDGLSQTISFQFDVNAHLTHLTQADMDTAYGYTADGQLQTVTNPDISTKRYTYDDLGLLQQSRDEMGNMTSVYHDDQGVPFSRTRYLDAQPLTTYYVHNAQRQLVYEINATGVVTAYAYDAQGNRISQKTFCGVNYDLSQAQPTVALPQAALEAWCAAQNPQAISLTEFQYNARGQVVRTIQYVHIDAAGHGILDAQAAQIVLVPDVFGQVLNRTEQQSATIATAQQQSFDGL